MTYSKRAFKKNRKNGTYTAIRELSGDDIVAMAKIVLGHRFKRGIKIHDPGSTKDFAIAELADSEHEVFACMFLDTRHCVIAFEKLFFGTIDGTSVHPRVIVKRALDHNAAAVIFAHNHPSGNTDPSNSDREITRRLIDALKLIDVRVLDHIVVGSDPPVSFAERGWV